MAGRVVVLAGQGAQFVGMGRDLAEAYPECRELFAAADRVLGYGLSQVCFEGPAEALTKTSHCQPGIFVTSVACFRALACEVGPVAWQGTAGLSLGEWTALHVAGALTFEDTVRVLEARGRFMQAACEERAGGMVSVIGLPRAKVEELAAASGTVLANVNAREQIVLSGAKDKVAQAEALAKQAGAKRTVAVLNVAGAYHSPLMASAAERLKEFLGGIPIRAPAMPVVSNVTGQPHGAPEEIRTRMVQQVTSPVQWLSCVEWFQAKGVTEYVECGPGKVLGGLVKRIDSAAVIRDIQDVATLKNTVTALKSGR